MYYLERQAIDLLSKDIKLYTYIIFLNKYLNKIFKL